MTQLDSANRKTPIHDGIADVQSSTLFTDQTDTQPLLIGLRNRRGIHHIEFIAIFVFLARKQFDIGAGEQSAQTRDALPLDTRLDHPQLAILPQQIFGIDSHARRDDDVGQILTEFDRLHHTDLDTARLDHGFTRLNPLGIAHG